jgi:vancomycin resistance protein VanW
MRYARWAFESWSYARERDTGTAGWMPIAEHRSRLSRDPARALLEMTAGKTHNLTLAAAALDGVVVHPGETLSFWFLVGEPSAAHGYRKGMELRSGCIVPSVGGGICQIASALYELALRAGWAVLEHHRHSMELLPEPDRIRPFGAAAAVLYPYRDLRVRNDGDQPVAIDARVEQRELVVVLRAPRPPWLVVSLEERNYDLVRRGDRVFRRGELWQRATHRLSGAPLWERRVQAREVEVMVTLEQHHCETCERVCPNAVRKVAGGDPGGFPRPMRILR